jgi:uncharacterized membrane protein YdjX (TVP38/TMEM64 family)
MQDSEPGDPTDERSAGRPSHRWRRWLPLALFLASGWVLREVLGLDFSADGVRAAVADAGFWAPVFYVGLLLFRTLLLIPSLILLPAGGLLFGAFEGSIYGTIGLTLSGLLNFGLVKWIGPETIRARVQDRFRGLLEIAAGKMGALALAVVSGYPAGPITFVQFGASIAGMGFFTYLVAVGSGSVVRAVTFSLFGASLVESDQLGWALAAIVCVVAIPLLIPRSRAWLVQGFGRNPGPAE